MKSKRVVAVMLILLNVAVCFTQSVIVKRPLKVDYFPYWEGGMLFNDDGGVNFYELDTAYQANMTLLIEKKTMHSYIIVDIEKAGLKKNITEKELVKNPYCYYTIASYGEIYGDMFYFGSIPTFSPGAGDTIYDYGFYKSAKYVYFQDYHIYKPKFLWKKGDYEGQFKNFYIVPFNKPVHKAILCLIKAKLINKYTGSLLYISIATDTTCTDRTPDGYSRFSSMMNQDEVISPYKFDNEEAFYKVLFPYADPEPDTTQVK